MQGSVKTKLCRSGLVWSILQILVLDDLGTSLADLTEDYLITLDVFPETQIARTQERVEKDMQEQMIIIHLACDTTTEYDKMLGELRLIAFDIASWNPTEGKQESE